ncbi:MAG: hypothetical protein ACLRVN_00670 [Butyricicoccus sp.]
MCGARAGSKGRMTRPEPKWHGKPRETYRISSDDREQQLGENRKEQGASHQG